MPSSNQNERIGALEANQEALSSSMKELAATVRDVAEEVRDSHRGLSREISQAQRPNWSALAVGLAFGSLIAGVLGFYLTETRDEGRAREARINALEVYVASQGAVLDRIEKRLDRLPAGP